MAKKATKKTAKRPYATKTPHEKIAENGFWTLPIKLESDVAKKILDEAESVEFGTAEYAKVINSRLRKAYGIK